MIDQAILIVKTFRSIIYDIFCKLRKDALDELEANLANKEQMTKHLELLIQNIQESLSLIMNIGSLMISFYFGEENALLKKI